jgi:hypothetical protein
MPDRLDELMRAAQERETYGSHKTRRRKTTTTALDAIVDIPRHRWPAAHDALTDGKHPHTASVDDTGRTVHVNTTTTAAHELRRYREDTPT